SGAGRKNRPAPPAQHYSDIGLFETGDRLTIFTLLPLLRDSRFGTWDSLGIRKPLSERRPAPESPQIPNPKSRIPRSDPPRLSRRFTSRPCLRSTDLGGASPRKRSARRSEEHTSELQSLAYLVCRLLLEKKKKN